MNKINYLFGATIIITTMILVPPADMLTSHLAKASTFTSSTSAVGVPNQRQAFAGHASIQRPPAPTTDKGCSSGGVSIGGQGTSCFAADNGQRQLAQLCHFCCIDI
ncbi:MAG: hypothetical protein WCF23_01195 [Candidatus Nitrosopolaris sp.]